MAKTTLPQPEKARFAGYSDSQVIMLLEQIATNAGLMADICRDEAEKAGDADHALTFHALSHMANGIGLLADTPTGGNVVGGFAEWMLGPLFKEKANGAGVGRTGPA